MSSFRRSIVLLVTVLTAVGAQAADLVIDTDTTWGEGSYVYDAVTVTAGATLTCEGVVSLQAASLTVDAGAAISADGTGWPGQQGPGAGANQGGGSHGGVGGHGTSVAGPAIYGSARSPATLGSGGGGGPYGAIGGAGGGALLLDIAGPCTVDGVLSADGDPADAPGGWDGGGGAGGTVRITAGSLTGNGSISADGGSAFINGHGGAGGRVFITTVDFTFTGGITAAAGASAAADRIPAEDGTVGLLDSGDNTFTAGQTWRFEAGDGPFAFKDVVIDGSTVGIEQDAVINASGTVAVTGTSTVGIYGDRGTVSITAGDLIIDSSSTVTVDGAGFPGHTGPGAGSNQGGGSHGGLGGYTENNPTGEIYGTALSPTTHGSGGGEAPYGTVGGRGGGAVRLDVEGACIIDGIITANGLTGVDPVGWEGGGGAGGSIFISTSQLSGAGTLRADGGPCVNRFAGGGGRIAVHFVSSDFTGSIHASGGAASGTGTAGEPGTVGLIDIDDNDLTTGPSWHFQVRDAPFEYDDVTIHGSTVLFDEGVTLVAGGTVDIDNGSLLTGLRRGDVAISARELSLAAGCAINVDRQGWPADEGPGAGEPGAGAGHGGEGGTNGSSTGGQPYGNDVWPVEPGSGGGTGLFTGAGGAGGGVITLSVTDTLVLDGELTADAGAGDWSGGGGSGGSILVSAGRIEGTGSLTATGGNGGTYGSASGGAGGRIAVRYNEHAFSGSTDISGGINGSVGEDGSERWIAAAGLHLGVPLEIDALRGVLYDFPLELSSGEAANLIVSMTPLGPADSWTLRARRGNPPAVGFADWSTAEANVDGQYQLLIPSPSAGTLHISVLTTDPAIVETTPFRILASPVERYLEPIVLGSFTNGTRFTTRIAGLGFTDGLTVHLLPSGTTTPAASFTADDWSPTAVTVTLDLAGASPQDYDIGVEWPDGDRQTIADALTVVAQAQPTISAWLTVPEVMRAGRTYTMWLDWVNNSPFTIPAPQFQITSTADVQYSILGSRPQRGAIQVLGGQYTFDGMLLDGTVKGGGVGDAPPRGATLDDMTLPPGVHRRVPIVITLPGTTGAYTFDLFLLPDDGTPIDWPSIADDIRPETMDDETWLRVRPLLQAKIGASWSDMASTLRANASYLASLGRTAFDHGSLLQLELNAVLGPCPRTILASAVDASAPSPGPPLAFTRVFANGIHNRQELGPLGRGWRHGFDVRIVEHASGNVSVRSIEGVRLFIRQSDGSFNPEVPSDTGRLRVSGSGWVLQETGGATLSFRDDGLLQWMRDPAGHGLDLDYDLAGNLSTVTHTSGDSFVFATNAHGRIETVTDHNGRTTTYEYDATGEYLTRVTSPGGVSIDYTYNLPGSTADPGDHALMSVRFPGALELSYEYDSWGRLIAAEKTNGAERVVYEYDDHGRTRASRSVGFVDIWWDERGRPVRARDNLGREVFAAVDEDDNLTAAWNGSQESLFVEYDHLGNPTMVTGPLGGVSRIGWTYPARGGALQRAVENPVGYRVVFDHAASGELSRITYPDGSAEQLRVATIAGNERSDVEQVIYTRADGLDITYTLNARGQITRKDLPDGSFVAYDYDSRGRVEQITDPSGTTVFTWNENDQLERIDYPDGHWVENTFNARGQRTRRVTDDGTTVDTEYDDAGRIDRVLVNAVEFISYGYDDDGRLTDEWRSNGTHSEYVWDADGRLDEVTHYDSSRAIMAQHRYEYPARSKIPNAIEGPQGRTELEHDARDRLIGVTYPDGLEVAIGYDAADNRNLVVEGAVPAAYSTNALGQYTQIGDAAVSWRPDGDIEAIVSPASRVDYTTGPDGRMTRVARSDGESWDYGYNAFNRQASITHNGRTRAIVTDPFSAAGRASEWEDDTGRIHIPGIGAVGYRQTDGSVCFFHFDGRGNNVLVTDGSGVVVTRFAYRAYGESQITAGTDTTDLRYAGRWGVADDGSGLLHTAERALHPRMGRFTSRAPDRSNQRPYQYAADSPIAFRDTVGIGAASRSMNPRPQTTQPAPTFQRAEEAVRIHEARRAGALTGSAAAAGTSTGSADIDSTLADIADIAQQQNAADLHALLDEAIHDLSTAMISEIKSGGLSGNGPSILAGIADLYHPPSGPTGPRAGGRRTGAGPTGPLGPGGRTGGRTGGRSGGPGPGGGRAGGASGPTPPGGRLGYGPFSIIAAHDPNEKTATLGDGPAHTVQPGEELTYTIFFENLSTASAPAQEVTVVDQLPAELDWSTFRATEIGWGVTNVPMPENATWYRTVETVDDWRPEVEKQWLVDVKVEPDLTTGEVRWSFRSLDPDTGALPADAYAGFLPPNDASHRGEGWVSFVCRTLPDLVEGTTVENDASIVFDLNEPIVTPVVFNTIGYPLCDPSGDGVMDAQDLAEMIRVLTEYGYASPGFADCDHMGGATINDLLWIIDRIHE